MLLVSVVLDAAVVLMLLLLPSIAPFHFCRGHGEQSLVVGVVDVVAAAVVILTES